MIQVQSGRRASSSPASRRPLQMVERKRFLKRKWKTLKYLNISVGCWWWEEGGEGQGWERRKEEICRTCGRLLFLSHPSFLMMVVVILVHICVPFPFQTWVRRIWLRPRGGWAYLTSFARTARGWDCFYIIDSFYWALSRDAFYWMRFWYEQPATGPLMDTFVWVFNMRNLDWFFDMSRLQQGPAMMDTSETGLGMAKVSMQPSIRCDLS